MADLTAQILVSDRYILYLYENERAAWKCIDLSYNRERKPAISWRCARPDTILKDGLLMIAIHCLEDKEIIKRALEYTKDKEDNDLTSPSWDGHDGIHTFNPADIPDKLLAELHAMNRKHSDRCSNCSNAQHPATRKLMYLDVTIFGQGMISKEWERELKQHHASVSIGYTEFMKGTERIRD